MSVVAAKGFTAAGVAAGIKPDGLDVAVVVAETAAPSAAVFTTNQAAAAPVLVTRRHLAASRSARAVVINSGCANAATGELGQRNAEEMASAVGLLLDAPSAEVLVCSTGTIGPQLPMEALRDGIAEAVRTVGASPDDGTDAATAIMTTDSVPKQSVRLGSGYVVGGMAKGAGMIRPNMATMLSVITTDAAVSAESLGEALHAAVDGSFNSLNIDGCESTNDTVIALASGASGVQPEAAEFTAVLRSVCEDLALQMARDAEGATRVVTIDMTGAATDLEARNLGRLISDSALVRSSFYGGDVNWGRILGALGTSDIELDMEAITVAYEGETVFSDGMGAPFDEPALLARLETGDISITVSVGTGSGAATIVTTDLTPEYVAFNGERS